MSPTAPAASSFAAHGVVRPLPRTRLEAHLLDALTAGESVRVSCHVGPDRSGPVEGVDLLGGTVRIAGVTLALDEVELLHRRGHDPVRSGAA